MKTKEIKKELAAIKALMVSAQKEAKSFDYTIQIRLGVLKRTVISEVYNGTDFDE